MSRSLKVGDIVKIISLNEISNSPKIGFIECMKEYCGKKAIIKRKIGLGEGNEYYKIDLDNQLFVEKEIMVLEIDFYTGNSGYKEGVDIILLPNPMA